MPCTGVQYFEKDQECELHLGDLGGIGPGADYPHTAVKGSCAEHVALADKGRLCEYGSQGYSLSS